MAAPGRDSKRVEILGGALHGEVMGFQPSAVRRINCSLADIEVLQVIA